MRLNSSFAGTAYYGAMQFMEEESFSWRTSLDETCTAKEANDQDASLPAIFIGPLVGTHIGEPIGSFQNEEPANAESGLGLQNDWSDIDTGVAGQVVLADASETAEASGGTDDALDQPEPIYGLDPSLEVSWGQPADHIASSNAWYLF